MNMLDRRGEDSLFHTSTDKEMKNRLYLRDARDSRRCKEKEKEEEFINAQPCAASRGDPHSRRDKYFLLGGRKSLFKLVPSGQTAA